MSEGPRRPLVDAALAAKAFAQLVDNAACCERWTVAGSIRRRKRTIGDIEIVAVPKLYPGSVLDAQLNALVKDGAIAQAQVNRPARSGIAQPPGPIWGERQKAILFRCPSPDGVGSSNAELSSAASCPTSDSDVWKIDLFIATPLNFGLLLLIRTGSREFTQAVMHRIKHGMVHRVGGGYLRPHFDGEPTEAQLRKLQVIPCRDEQTVFAAARLPYIEPPERELPMPVWVEQWEREQGVPA